jgi:hypothetical protein
MNHCSLHPLWFPCDTVQAKGERTVVKFLSQATCLEIVLHVIGFTGAMYVAERVMKPWSYCSLRRRGFVHRFES